MKFTSESKFLLGVLLSTVAIIGVASLLLTKPEITKPIDIAIPKDATTKGNRDGVALVEFSDFQCPACKAFEPVVQEILQTYRDKLFLVYFHYPLPQHAMAEPAARAAEAAGLQRKFWEMHDLLFTNQNRLAEPLFFELAQQLKLNVNIFQTDYTSEAIREKVSRDRAYGQRLGIKATPTFFLAGILLQPATPQDLKKAVEEYFR